MLQNEYALEQIGSNAAENVPNVAKKLLAKFHTNIGQMLLPLVVHRGPLLRLAS